MQREIVDLPLNGRNFSQLGVLQTGVVPLTPGLAEAGGSLAEVAAIGTVTVPRRMIGGVYRRGDRVPEVSNPEVLRRRLSVLFGEPTPVRLRRHGIRYNRDAQDVPLHYGQGMSPAARTRNAMMEAFVASEPGIEAAFEAGVDVRLGTACWGPYANGPGVAWMPGTYLESTAAMPPPNG